MTATRHSTAGDATLSVADPSATATGHLVNGTFSLAQALQVAPRAPTAVGCRGRRRRHGRPDHAADLERPGRRRAATLTFKQSIGVTDALRTGSYAKTLTFTLSTTTP